MKQPKERLAVPGLSSWISLELRLSKYRDDPRRVILVANRPEKCQSERYDCACCDKSLSEQAQSARMSAWRESVLAANAKKAGSASKDTHLTPRPPSFTRRLA